MTRTAYVLLAICFLIIVVHIWGAASPSHWNWGVHLFAFYNPLLSLTALALSCSLFFPNNRKNIRRVLDGLLRKFSSLPLIAVLAMLACALVALSFIFQAKLHLLGDGALLLRVISGLTLKEESPPAFDHQPLVEMIFRQLKSISQIQGLLNPEALFLLVDIVMGLVFIVIVALLIRTFTLSTVDKILLGCFIFFCAGSQFFFGYVELYVLLYAMTACYIITGWFALERRLHLSIPVVCYGVMLGLHFGAVALFPSVVILMYGTWRERKLEALSIAGASIVVFLIFIIVRHVDFRAVVERIDQERIANILPMFRSDADFVNPMISVRHFLDWANDNLLVAPFSFLTTIVLLISMRKQIRWSNPLVLFLLTAALCGAFFTYSVSTALGMARDWDFLASFFLPLILLNVYLLKLYLGMEEGKSIVAAIVALSFLHWIAWIGINSSEEKHLERARLLDNPRLLGRVAQLNYYETMGAFFYSRSDYRAAQPYFEHFVEIESSYTRVLANVSDLYKKLGDEERSFHYLKRAADIHTLNPSVYMDLGVMYASRGDTASAIAFNRQALRLDSNYAKAHANLGILYFLTGKYDSAAGHYAKALALGLDSPFLFRDAGSSFFFLEEYEQALHYYDAYLALVPDDAKTRNVRNKIQEWLSQEKK